MDEDHNNYNYVELFSIDIDNDKNSMIVLIEVIDEKLINSTPNL